MTLTLVPGSAIAWRMDAQTPELDTLSFEDALRELETIVRQLESGEEIGRASCRERV